MREIYLKPFAEASSLLEKVTDSFIFSIKKPATRQECVQALEYAQNALDLILNALHYTHGGGYPLNYTPRRPEMAGYQSDPWVAAHLMKNEIDKKLFKSALHGMLVIRALLKGYKPEELTHKAKELVTVLHPIVKRLAERETLYQREHFKEGVPIPEKVTAKKKVPTLALPHLLSAASFVPAHA